MCAFVDDFFFHSGQPVEDDGSCATLDIVEGLLEGEGADSCWNGEPVETLESALGHDIVSDGGDRGSVVADASLSEMYSSVISLV